MKVNLRFRAFFLALLTIGAYLSAQEKAEMDLAQKVKFDAMRENLVRQGMSYSDATNRINTVFLNEQTVSLRARLATPGDSSIWVDRDVNNWGVGNYHPTYHSYTPEQLVKKVLLGDPRAESAISNVKFKGTAWDEATKTWTADNRSLLYFENGKYLGIEKGLLLATGPGLQAEGPNIGSGQMGGGVPVTGDPDLSKICSAVTSGSVLEFDFVPYSTRATFDFIFVSDEYGDYSNSHGVNDAFGFFVSKTNNPTDTINIAKFPNDSLVTISNSNWGHRGDESSAYYAAHPADTTGYSSALTWNATQKGFYVPSGSAIAVNPQWHIPNPTDGGKIMTYDGQTIKLQAVADSLVIGESYHLKLAICNKSDMGWGSAVFLANLNLGIPSGSVEVPYSTIAAIDSTDMDANGDAMSVYAGCTYPMTLKFTPSSPSFYPLDVEFKYINIDSTAVLDENGKQIPSKFQLANVDDTLRTFNVQFSTDYKGFKDGEYVGLVVGIVGGAEDTVLYRKLYDTLSWDVKYLPITEVNNGSLNINILSGGTSETVYRKILDGTDINTRWKSLSSGFTAWELLSLGDSADILLYRANECNPFDTVRIRLQTGDVTIYRYVDIPSVAGVETAPVVGKHYVGGHDDFTFYAKFNGTPLKVNATGYYTGDVRHLEETAIKQDDGSYKYTIRQVTEPWTISFGSVITSGETMNDAITGQNVWSSGNTLYISTENASVANVYTLTGTLVKQITVNGTTGTQLSTGFYIVSMNGKQYKVMVK